MTFFTFNNRNLDFYIVSLYIFFVSSYIKTSEGFNVLLNLFTLTGLVHLRLKGAL